MARPADRFDEVEQEQEVAAKADKPLSSLLKDLVEDLRRLLRQEVELARTETGEKIAAATSHLKSVAVGAVLLLAAALVLTAAVNRGLTVLLSQWMPAETAVWLAPLILGVLLATVGGALYSSGVSRIRRMSPVPERTVTATKETVQWAKERR